MSNFFWFFYALILVVGRTALLCSLYFLKTPTGSYIVADWNRFLWHTMFAEIGFAMAMASLFLVISNFVRGRGAKILKWAAFFVAAAYFVACGTDDEVMRWMNQRLTLSFLGTYMNAVADMGLVGSIFKGDIFHFLLTVVLVLSSIAGVGFFLWKRNFSKLWDGVLNRKSLVAAIIILIFAILGCTSHMWFNPSHRRWPRIKPIAYVFAGEIFQKFKSITPPENFDEGVRVLAGDPSAEFPFWKVAVHENESLESFRKRPIEEKPDIILLTIESLRGWTSDIRVPETCLRLPNLCKLANRGAYYPNAYSVGYPSIEGFLGIMTGVLSHPHGTLLYDYPNTRMRSISDILGDAGYYRMVLCGADPSFDNELVWQQKWFDYNEFKPENDNDVAIANRFVELYKNRDVNKPLFFHWMSRSMHIPFALPKDMGETPKDVEVAYLRAEAYMDSALGIIMGTVDSLGRNTLIVLTGDHSYPTNAQTASSDQLGKIHDGETWVDLIFAGSGIEPRVETRPVSQSDIAPTIVGYLGLEVSNHFMGVNLMNNQNLPPVFSFRLDDIAMHEDSLSYFSSIEGGFASAYRTYLEPDWDTSHPVEGFVSGKIMELGAEEIAKATRKMRAAALAWEYVVNKNILMPPNN